MIYLDNNATTPIDPKILELITKDLKENFGNPSSSHSLGRMSKQRLTHARDQVAHYLKVNPKEIVFTSSGTEALNMIIKGICALKTKGHIITSNVEHAAVEATLKQLEESGWKVTYLPAGQWGAISVDSLRNALQSDTKLIVLMAVNNETGVKTDISSIAQFAERAGVDFVVDGVSWLGKEEVNIPKGVSAVCFSGHKIHAPKGVGFAYVKQHTKWQPLIVGGDQEYGRRGGTENVSAIMALGQAVEMLGTLLPQASNEMERLRDDFEKQLMNHLPFISINGQGPRISNTSNICFTGIDGETLLAHLDRAGVAASLGSACSSGAVEPSKVLTAMGIPSKNVRSSLRFSLSRMTTQEEINKAVDIIVGLV